jgi:hypothetical protein
MQNRFSDDIASLLISNLRSNSLSKGFIRNIWEKIPLNKDKTEEMFDTFLQEFRKRNLIAE